MTPTARRFVATEENQQTDRQDDWPTIRALDSSNTTLRCAVGHFYLWLAEVSLSSKAIESGVSGSPIPR